MNETFCHQKKVVAGGRASFGSDPRQLAWRVSRVERWRGGLGSAYPCPAFRLPVPH